MLSAIMGKEIRTTEDILGES